VNHTIAVPVDVTNPGQFFACCGLLELAARIWPGARGRFDRHQFLIEGDAGPDVSLSTLLEQFRRCPFTAETADDPDDDSTEGSAQPMTLGPPFNLLLNWWDEKSLKTWAGSMNASLIFIAMRAAVDPECLDPFNDLRVVHDPPSAMDSAKKPKKPEKREPFYFDCRRGGSAKSLDVGFSVDGVGMTSATCPAVESLCLVGLQRFRPSRASSPRVFDYWTWRRPLPPLHAAAAVCGALPLLTERRFRFENAFRSDQRKHKGFLPAQLMSQGDIP